MITDPPWRISGGGKFGECADYPLLTVDEVAEQVRPARRALIPGGHMYCFAPAGDALPEILDAFRADGWRFVRQLAWDRDWKWGLGAYRNAWEPILVFANGPARGFNMQPSVPSLLRARSAGVRTAKPWQLYKTFILKSTTPGELVVDPFCGTNPLAVAARRLSPARRWLAADVLSPDEIQRDMERRSTRTPEVASASRRAGHVHPGETGLGAYFE
jgi:site-specific DNA-methyltransferase (adenine-specific)